MAVNLLAPLERYGADALAAARVEAERLGYRLVRTDAPDERLCAWIDWTFAPSWWSSEVRDGSVWTAYTREDEIAGFAAFGNSERAYPWLRPYAIRYDLGMFGPYGVHEAHRGSGIGAALLTAALSSLAETMPAALIPAVSGERLIAMYERRTGAQIVDEYAYPKPATRTVILASGSGTNAQAVIDAVAAGRLGLNLVAVVTNDAEALVRARARRADIVDETVVWDRASEKRAAFDERVIATLDRYQPELVLLLGWMHVLPPEFLALFPDTINVHPAFLPFDPADDEVTMPDGSRQAAFRGARAPEATIAAAVPWGGVSVHRVTPATDRGGILVRTPFPIAPGAGLAEFRATVRPLEHAAVEKAIRRWTFER